MRDGMRSKAGFRPCEHTPCQVDGGNNRILKVIQAFFGSLDHVSSPEI